MARAKKQKLSLEELLEQTLLKEDEYPYKVPSNWIWCNVSNFFENLTSGTKKIQQKSYTTEGDFAIIDQGKELIGGYTSNSELVFDGELPVIIFGDHTRVIKYIDFPFVQGADGVKVLKPLKHVNEKFFYYLLQNLDIPDLGYRRHFKLLSSLNSPFPPLTEQQRIVETIESLFEKLDTAKELVQDALESFEKRKAAILHKAFTGELTAKWREENSISLDSWELCEVGKLGEVKGGKRLPKGESLVNENTGFPYIKAGDLKNGTVLVDRLQYVKPEIEKVIKNYTVKKGDIYITIVGACIGDVGVIPEEVDGANLTENAAKITNLKCNNKYLAICLSSSKMQQQIKEKIASATLGKLSLTSIKSLIVPLPTFKEQCEIVDILENLLDKEVQAQELCDVIAKIDLMKKSILARAFRGELDTNKPEEESAIELLKEVLKEKL